VPAARLFDETLKLFLSGHGERSMEVLRQRQLLEVLFPGVERYLAEHADGLVEKLLRQGLRNTDERVASDKPVSPTFLFALLLYGPIASIIESLPPQRWHEVGAIVEACDRALRVASTRVTIPRRVALGVREMYGLQPRLEQPRGKRALRLLEQPRFRSAFDLLMLRAQLGLAPAEIADFWTRLQEAAPEQRPAMMDALAKPRGGARPSAGAAASAAPSAAESAAVEGEAGAAAPPAAHRRRRRRRFRGPA
jgi:poly(A) polymerase